ncbi:NUDIX domain-containing protein [bacterium]|jgi:8-oxo-dGTP diphosphatase|nr:NUDIX domain-containing protein [bacterium]MBT4894590.1 NUDIX domain-containing protein [bacterium]MBT6049614.1 NUDIX domain-containing protein [Candidatus Scalindua sp.]
MKTLGVFNNKQVSDKKTSRLKNRVTTRAVVLDANKHIAILHSIKNNYYEIPGGGVEQNETIEESCIRECKEETGCVVEITNELGKTIEKIKESDVINETYCYVAKLIGNKGIPVFEEHEIEDVFEVIWVDIDKAIHLVGKTQHNNPYHTYMQQRALLFLNTAKELLKI